MSFATFLSLFLSLRGVLGWVNGVPKTRVDAVFFSVRGVSMWYCGPFTARKLNRTGICTDRKILADATTVGIYVKKKLFVINIYIDVVPQ